MPANGHSNATGFLSPKQLASQEGMTEETRAGHRTLKWRQAGAMVRLLCERSRSAPFSWDLSPDPSGSTAASLPTLICASQEAGEWDLCEDIHLNLPGSWWEPHPMLGTGNSEYPKIWVMPSRPP
jgi:hypothetical protein